MAAYCPKCNYKLSLIDLKPECPVCGVNLMYYGMEERLEKEADKAEYDHAKFQPRIDRLKSGTIGSPWSIARLVITFLPILTALIPMGKISVTLPFFTEHVQVGLISVITKVLMDLDLDYYTMMLSSGAGQAYLFFLIALAAFLLTLVLALVNLINLFMAAAPRGIRRNVTIASIGTVTAALAVIFYSLYASKLTGYVPQIFTGSLTAGCIPFLLANPLVIAINLVIKKKNLPVKYTDVSQLLIPYAQRDHSGDAPAEAVELET